VVADPALRPAVVRVETRVGGKGFAAGKKATEEAERNDKI